MDGFEPHINECLQTFSFLYTFILMHHHWRFIEFTNEKIPFFNSVCVCVINDLLVATIRKIAYRFATAAITHAVAGAVNRRIATNVLVARKPHAA